MSEDKLKKMEELKHVIKGLEEIKSWIVADRVSVNWIVQTDEIMKDYEGNELLAHIMDELDEMVKWIDSRIRIYTNHLRKLQGLKEDD